MNATEPQMKRVVVYRVGSLGDALVVLPAFHLVRQAFPDAHLTLLTSFPISAKAAPMESILQHTGLYDDTLRYPTFLRDFRELVSLRRQLKAGHYDALVYLAKPKGSILTSIRDYLFFRSCGIPKVIGVPFSRRTLRCDLIPGTTLHKSETVRTMESLESLGTADLKDPKWWDMRLTPAEIGEAERVLATHGITAPFLAASVGTKIQAKDWEEPNWMELMRRLAAAHPGLPLVLFGVTEEKERSDRMLALWRGPKANLCGETSPRVSAAVLRHAAVMVCHDSGPMHLAATMGVPCVAIFSARHAPGEWYPRGDHHTIFYRQPPCWGCGLTECIEKKKVCILSITVDEVCTAVLQQLAARGIAAAADSPPHS
jgi:ADP-heptose:LPS heptosyltransferase